MNNPAEQTMYRRPVGVTIISILVALGGILTLISAFALFFGVGIFGFHIPAGIRGLALLYGFIAALIGILQLAFSWGLWSLKQWAFWAVVIIEMVNIVQALIFWLTRYLTFGSFLLAIVFPVIILIYFLADHHVRDAFGLKVAS